MLPKINVLGFEVAMYGLMIVLGLVAGILVALARAKSTGFKKEDLVFASLYGAIGTVAGAKLLYLLTVLRFVTDNFYMIIKDRELMSQLISGGFVFYGGVIGGVSAIFIYCRRYRLDFLPLIDALIPSVPLAHAFGRLGCFFAGCCYGIEHYGPLGMYFDKSPFAPHGIPLFPVQLVEAACNFAIFMFLILIARRARGKGALLGCYLMSYTIARFILEYFRWDEYRGFLFGLSTSQWISIILFIAGMILIDPARKRRTGEM
ncbi:MAG: prolipoprotein diacylglyceryl transferase [Clostridiales bacterium]|nr:prolipoprotein diacylglyceryl transferase [Clostridiales bacterium]